MSMKKTDLEKHLAKKLDGKMKSGIVPQRFGQSPAGARPERKSRNSAVKLVPVACRLPAELVSRLRERAVGHEGGMQAIMAQAVALWLESSAGATPASDASQATPSQ
jgi:hypothetical protein